MSNDHTIKAVQTLVIVMTTLIMAGLGLVAYGLLVRGTSASSQTPPVGKERIVSETDLVPFGTIVLAQPPGTRIAAMTVAGRRLFLWLQEGELGERIVLVDLATGGTLGTVTVGSALLESVP